jgi:hypothetical protein
MGHRRRGQAGDAAQENGLGLPAGNQPDPAPKKKFAAKGARENRFQARLGRQILEDGNRQRGDPGFRALSFSGKMVAAPGAKEEKRHTENEPAVRSHSFPPHRATRRPAACQAALPPFGVPWPHSIT